MTYMHHWGPRARELAPCLLCDAGVPKRPLVPHKHRVFYEGVCGYVGCRGPGCAVCAAHLLARNGPYGARRRSPLTALWLLDDRRTYWTSALRERRGAR